MKILSWLRTIPLLLNAAENLDKLRAEHERLLRIRDATVKEFAEQAVALEVGQNTASATVSDLRDEIEHLRAEIRAAKEMRHRTVTAALRQADLQGKKVIGTAHREALMFYDATITDAQATADKIMRGAEDYAAAMRASTVDDILQNMKNVH